jgi:hypothetical protein
MFAVTLTKHLPLKISSEMRSFCHDESAYLWGYVKERGKDIIFFASDSCMVLPLVHLTVDTSLMQACPDLFAVCN